MPNNSAQLHLPRGTFNSKYKQQIRYADSNRKLTIPNLYMIFYQPIIEYTGMTRPDPRNVHCASIRMKIEITFYDAHMPLEENGELTS